MAKASAKVTGKLVTVTGFKDIDAKLKQLPEAVQKKLLRSAMRTGVKRVQKAFVANVQRDELIDTKAFMQSTKAKALKRSRTRFGVGLFTDTQAMYARRKKKLTKSKDKLKDIKGTINAKDEFFYPAVLEFGSEHFPAKKPMRRALYENEKALRASFQGDMKPLIDAQHVGT